MKAFGLELRKTSSISVKSLYWDVDKVLESKGIRAGSGEVTRELQADSIAHSLQKMLRPNNHFSVCTVKNCAEMASLYISKERIEIYQSCHCMDYSDMTEGFRTTLIAMLLDDFRTVLNPEEQQDITDIATI